MARFTATAPGRTPAPAGQRLRRAGRPAGEPPLLRLQRSSGNQALLRLLDRPAGVIRRCSGGVECAPCEAERLGVQRQATGAPAAGGVPASVGQTLRDPGQPLDPAARAMFEPRFGHDFGDVRVHTGALASASARAVAARAYTAGRHIVFGAGAYAPAGPEGRRLLAHELAHVVQQRAAAGAAPTEVGRANDPAERDARAAASSVVDAARPAPNPVPLAAAPAARLARQDEEETGAVAADEPDPGEVRDGDVPVVGASSGAGEEPVLVAGPDVPSAKPTQAGGKTGGAKQPPEKRWITKIDVDLSAQELTVTWSDGTTDDPHPISSGRGRPNTKEDPCKTQQEKNCTPVGTFTAGRKGSADTANTHGDAMSWYLGFVDDRGIGIHDSQPVVKGTPRSHGCVRVGDTKNDDAFARKLNVNSRSGKTVIEVHGKAPTKPWTTAAPKPKKPAKPKK
jgi:lipoprotein-anchoring transpeptidase ErfK/SrfK